MSKCFRIIHQTEHRRVHVLGGTNSFEYLSWLLYCCVPILITTFPPNLSETYPWPRYGVPSTCLGHSNVIFIHNVGILAYPSI